MVDGGTELRGRLRAILEEVAGGGVQVTYADTARRLGLEGPRKIHRIALALEHLMAEDAAAGRPFIAALVISRARDGLPAPGFFDAARRLGRFGAAPDGSDPSAFHRSEVVAAQAHYGRAANSEPAEADRLHTGRRDVQQFIGPSHREQSDDD